jgi:hypothetical protein
LIDTALILEDLTRNASVHAAGVVIGDQPLVNLLPLKTDEDGAIVTQYAMNPVGDLGLLKMDFLGLKTLTVIRNTCGNSDLAFRFRADGSASITITVDSESSTTRCSWSVINNRISLTNDRGQVRWFTILESGKDSLTLRIKAGPAGICAMRRTGED